MKITVTGIPKAQPRAKAYIRGKHAGVYNPKTADDWKCNIRSAVMEQADGDLILGAVSLEICFYFPRPKAHFGTGKNAGVLKQSSPIHHTAKPDLDNLTKAVKDAITDTGAVWRDDSQVSVSRTAKVYCHANAPGALIVITKVEP